MSEHWPEPIEVKSNECRSQDLRAPMTTMSPTWLQKCRERSYGVQVRANEAIRVDSLLGQKTSRGSAHRHHQFTSGSSEKDRECYDGKV